jgi:hypothetical protein
MASPLTDAANRLAVPAEGNGLGHQPKIGAYAVAGIGLEELSRR